MSESPQTKGQKPPPYPLCLLVCEQVIVDETSKNRTAVGIFSDILAASFPAVHPRLAVYIELTNGHGHCALELRLINAATDETLVAVGGAVNFTDPRHVAHLRFNFNGLVFNTAGEYRFQLFAEHELLMERRILVKQVTQPGTAG
jgi:hypothetical protein